MSTLIVCWRGVDQLRHDEPMNSGCANASPPEHLISQRPGSAAKAVDRARELVALRAPPPICLHWMQYEQS